MKTTREQKIFVPAALAASILSITGFNVYARMKIGAETFDHALSESLYYSGIQMVGTIWLIAPFVVIGLISSVASKKERLLRGWCFFFCGVVPLMAVYLRGYLNEALLLEQKKWTASIFAVAFLPFMGAPILIALGIALIAFKAADKMNSEQTNRGDRD
ncbi:MAG TPA: hypothetical protein VN328_02840 [Thermodesulfovibrionales bacterium]|nr:hypothetical protein [Thermodesulfovibrionales bacterium]